MYENVQSYQVLQRDSNNKASVRLKNGEVLELSVGGPYTIDDAHDVLVGDIWLLAGQSNMEGIGDLINVEKPSPFVHSFQSREEWAIAEEPLHWLGETQHIVHHSLWGDEQVPPALPPRDPNRNKGAGLGIPFAKERYIRTGVPVGLIPSAHGGTSMEQWNPELRDRGSASLYGATLERFKSIGGRIAGILWYQGESDAYPEGVELYQQRMIALIQAFRTDFSQPDLPFYFVQLGRFTASETSNESWNGIRELQRQLSTALPNVAMTAAIDLELDDVIHIGTQGLKRLGRRLADIADGQLPPEVDSVTFDAQKLQIRVSYKHVRGNLHAAGRPQGFSLRSRDGKELIVIYKVTLDEHTAILHLVTNELPKDVQLFYGWGCDPYCNIIDGADASLPAFGPLSIHTS